MKRYIEDSFIESSLCGVGSQVRHYTSGSSSSSTSVDKEYNRVVAALQVQNQQMVDELYDTYKTGVGTYSYADIEPIMNKKGTKETSGYYNPDGSLTKRGQKAKAANQWVINPDTGKLSKKTYTADPDVVSQQQLEQKQIEANMELLPAQTELEKLTLAEQTAATKQSGLARNKLFDTTMAGTDVRGAMGRAQADVEQGSGLAMQSARNQAFRSGVDPNSSQYMKLQEQLLTNKAKGIAGARTGARVMEEDKNYERLAGLSTYGL